MAKLKSYPTQFRIFARVCVFVCLNSVNTLNKFLTVANKIVGLKSMAAHRSGLEIDPSVSKVDAEDGLRKELASKHIFCWEIQMCKPIK